MSTVSKKTHKKKLFGILHTPITRTQKRESIIPQPKVENTVFEGSENETTLKQKHCFERRYKDCVKWGTHVFILQKKKRILQKSNSNTLQDLIVLQLIWQHMNFT